MPTTITMKIEESESTIRCDRYVLVAWNEEGGERSAAVVHCNNPVMPEPALELSIETIAGALTHSMYPHAVYKGASVLTALASAETLPAEEGDGA